ncbi:MAG: lasso peptide biosynthesis B2 protein [Gammaproteobacteria bacterium]|nr:lasso peptide biosynthesis B2 protein [Gammaproteobacteria bacterium]
MNTTAIKNLSAAEWLWLVEGYARLCWVRACLRWAGDQWLKSRLQSTNIAPDDAADVVGLPQRKYAGMHESIRLAARLQGSSVACLPRSLVLAAMLQRRGCAARTVLGVAKNETGIASHAWVEVNGQPVSEPEQVSQDFARVTRS